VELAAVLGRVERRGGESPPSGTRNIPVLELHRLAIFDELSPDELGACIDMLARDVEQGVGRMRAAVHAGDAETVLRVAHRLKSGAAGLGGARVAELCGALEEQARLGVLAGAGEGIARLEEASAEHLAALRDRLRSLRGAGALRPATRPLSAE
jgi:HPt (histidine-containing phosphotransfer) domain-containing protein